MGNTTPYHRAWLLAGFAILTIQSVNASPAEDYFESKVRPVLIKNCYGCHTELASGGLRLDSRDAILKGGHSGPAIVPGKPEDSLLVKAIHYQSRLRMPPPGELDAGDIAAIEQWISDGAPWPDKPAAAIPAPVITEKQKSFWSFQKPVNPPIPEVKDASWAYNDIDHFVLAKLEEKKLTPAKDADQRTLARRVYLDLTGLPPTPEEMQQYLSDKSPQAYEHLIDRLLDTKAYAERWGRMWLDVVRYSDTAGNGADYPVPLAYKYRDWVISAFQHDMPYDEFVREQIAGDLLPSKSEPDHWNKVVATGYLAIARRASDDEIGTISDAVDNLGYAYLGLSVACARCHNHKFDPIPTRDYYALFGILKSTQFSEPGSEVYRYERNIVYRDPNVTKSQAYLDFQAQLKPIKDSLVAVNELPYFDDILPLLHARRMELFKKEPKFEAAYAVTEGKPSNAEVLIYGDPKNPAGEVPRGFLEILGGETVPKGAGSGRLQLASWIATPDNPLTARVMVNRIWQGHFGRGIVATPNDFGSRGSAPTDQPLLDYLATRFVEKGWSVKAMQREILLSHAYRISTSRVDADATIDADDLYQWRQERRRMDAEEIRDSMLDISGLLDTSPAGPQPFPPAYEWNYSGHVPFSAVYQTDRRSVYLMVQRIRQHPYLGLFDAPDPNASTPSRSTNITSLQALYFMNGELPRRCADHLAESILHNYTGATARIDRAYEAVLNRPPAPAESDRIQTFLAKASADFKSKGDSDADASLKSMSAFIETLFSTNEFLFVN